jgi:transcriptional regulator with XRE-family HTH domain
MTQEELATVASVDRKTIGNYERGRVPASAPRVPDGYYQVALALDWLPADINRLLAAAWGNKQAKWIDVESKLHDLRHELRGLQREGAPPDDQVVRQAMARASLMDWELAQMDSPSGIEASAPTRDSGVAETMRRRAPSITARLGDARERSASRPDPLSLFPAVSRFGQACVALGADPALRDAFEDAAQTLLQQATDPAAASRDDYDLAAYRPHGWAEGDPAVPADDAARIRKAVEEHKRNR